MTRLEELNVEWIGICNLMQMLNKQRIEVYLQWKGEMEREGHIIDENENFPLTLDKTPSFYRDLYGEDIYLDK